MQSLGRGPAFQGLAVAWPYHEVWRMENTTSLGWKEWQRSLNSLDRRLVYVEGLLTRLSGFTGRYIFQVQFIPLNISVPINISREMSQISSSPLCWPYVQRSVKGFQKTKKAWEFSQIWLELRVFAMDLGCQVQSSGRSAVILLKICVLVENGCFFWKLLSKRQFRSRFLSEIIQKRFSYIFVQKKIIEGH